MVDRNAWKGWGWTGAVWTELKIITTYALFPSLMVKILGLVNWDFELLISIIKFFVFIQITYNEDTRTMTQSIFTLLVRLSILAMVFFSLEYAVDFTKNKSFELAESKGWNWSPKNESWFSYDKSVLFLWKLSTEYFKFIGSLVNYRLTFVGMAVSIFLFLRILLWLVSGKDEADDF